jgi:hypothetical protein
MRDRGSPWKWPLCIGLAFGLVFLAVYLVPRSWINAFFSPLSLAERFEKEQGQSWLTLLPPLTIQMVPDRQPEIPETPVDLSRLLTHHDPDWWSRGWRVMTMGQEAATGRAADVDSVRILLTALGVERDFMSRARPDSVLAVRLFMLKVEDSFKFDELKPYLTAMARARDYADIMSRAADMYDDFLRTEIMTPD